MTEIVNLVAQEVRLQRFLAKNCLSNNVFLKEPLIAQENFSH
jgi:hypothetical protein